MRTCAALLRKAVHNVDILGILAPFGLCLAAICVAALVYAIVVAIKGSFKNKKDN